MFGLFCQGPGDGSQIGNRIGKTTAGTAGKPVFKGSWDCSHGVAGLGLGSTVFLGAWFEVKTAKQNGPTKLSGR